MVIKCMIFFPEYEETRKKRRLVEEELREKKMDFEKIRKVTQIADIQMLPGHKEFLEYISII